MLALVAAGERRAPAGLVDDLIPGARGPSVVLITTDDQTFASLKAMKKTRDILVGGGVSFTSSIASFPLCCPARATWLSGQHAHSHGVIDNNSRNGGGYGALRDPGRVLPVWLDAVGYDTALIGKFLHEYPGFRAPPGWDRYWGVVPPQASRYFDYVITNTGGGVDGFKNGDRDYLTDVLSGEYALPYLLQRNRDPDPFFLHVSYTAPHWGQGRSQGGGDRCRNGKPFSIKTARAKPAPRHLRAFRRARLPKPPSFNEPDTSDKPAVLAGKKRLKKRQIRELRGRYRCELASLLAVDDGVAAVWEALQRSGRADETYVIFTSDNGYMHGEHRIPAEKVYPYEEAIRVPFVVRGPGIPRGVRAPDPVSNVDLAATILELAGVEQPLLSARPLEGRSLAPQLFGARFPNRAVLIEAKRPPRRTKKGVVIAPSFTGVRTARYSYIEHHRAIVGTVGEGLGLPIGAGPVVEHELYDLARDRFQVQSQHESPAYAAPRGVLAGVLARLRGCSGSECVIDAPVPPPATGR